MKKIIVIVLFTCCHLTLRAQQADTLKLYNQAYEFVNSLSPRSSPQRSADNPSGPASAITAGHKITAIYEKQDASKVSWVYYKYWNFTDATKRAALNTSSSGDLIFMMPKDLFVQLVKPLYKKYKGATMGAYTIPFRLRGSGGGGFDFESSLSLQANVVFGFGRPDKEHSWLDASVGIGLTGVQLNEKNSEVSEARTASAFTTSIGILFKPAPFANIGVFLGTDLLGKNDREVKWVYNRKPWIGLGINISFNQIKSPGSQTPTDQK